MEFQVYGKITIDVTIDIDADSEEEALAKATEELKDYYHLNVVNAYHDDVKIDLDATEYE